MESTPEGGLGFGLELFQGCMREWGEAAVQEDWPDSGIDGHGLAGRGKKVGAVDGAVRTTLSLLPGVDLVVADEAQPEDTQLSAALGAAFTPLAAVGFLVFVLVYTPCVATLAAIRNEFGWRWAALSGVYQFGIAWLLAVVIFQVGTFLGYA